MPRALSTVLRPYLSAQVKPRNRDIYLRFYAAATSKASTPPIDDGNAESKQLWSSGTYRERVKQLSSIHQGDDVPTAGLYPRLEEEPTVTPKNFRLHWDPTLKPGDFVKENYTVQGKITSIRAVSSKLMFIDVSYCEAKLQVKVNLGMFLRRATVDPLAITNFRKSVSVGDYYSFKGEPEKTPAGELTLCAQELPQLLAPSLHRLPEKIEDEGTLARFPQLDLVMQQRRRDLLRLRHTVEKTIADFLDDLGFTKVTTPILAADTGGAAAQPFETVTNEIPDIPLRMRIAQELSLKKLVAAGMGPVYEIGPCFRNEGLDGTHNPEFTTCEFYQPFVGIEGLIEMTELLMQRIAKATHTGTQTRLTSLTPPKSIEPNFNVREAAILRFKRLPFLPTLLTQIRTVAPDFRLPPVLDDTAAPDLLALFTNLHLTIPSKPTTARLLDALCARFIEPSCTEPTFITEHPAIMSPLAKSYRDPKTDHLISARAELFIKGVEYINLYEEENDPFTQARKFLQQAHGSAALVNVFGTPVAYEQVKQRLRPGQQYYLRVLEMGLPPTGGWGAGIDRLVMYFGGAKRIGEVMPFGGLRSVVAMGTGVDGKGKLIVGEKEREMD